MIDRALDLLKLHPTWIYLIGGLNAGWAVVMLRAGQPGWAIANGVMGAGLFFVAWRKERRASQKN